MLIYKASCIILAPFTCSFLHLTAPPLERKTDFRPKHIPRSQSAHYVKHSPRRSLPRCGHHALVCIPMLSTKIRIIFTQFKNAIQAVFCIRNPVYFLLYLSIRSIRWKVYRYRNQQLYWGLKRSCLSSSSIRRHAKLHTPRPSFPSLFSM